MKKKLLLSTILLSSLALASDYKYEISPLLGINSAEGNLGFRDNSYITGALEFQMNSKTSQISPEFSLLYAPKANYSIGGSTDIMRLMANGVYKFNKLATITPFVKAGVGMELLSTNKAGNEDRPFADAGLGIKAAITDKIALKLETLYLLKHTFTHAGSADSNLVTLFGVTYAFGEQNTYHKEENDVSSLVKHKKVIQRSEKTAPKRVIPPVQVLPTSIDETKVQQKKYLIAPSKDTALDLHITFEYKSTKVSQQSLKTIVEYADYLKEHPAKQAEIIGYTDSIGSAQYNKKLSKKRAQAVVDLLIQYGVKPSQLVAVGMGEANPIADNKTASGRAHNRRIETKLIN